MKVAKVSIVAFVVMCCVNAFGQKKESTTAQYPKGLSKQIIEKYKPIPLTTSLISGELQDSNSGKYHYYTFMAGPGEITLTLSVESYPRSSSNMAIFTLFDNNEQWLGGGSTMSIPSMPHQTETEISIPSKQPVLLRITEGVNFGLGKYQIKISGAAEFSLAKSSTENENLNPLLQAKSSTENHDPLLDATSESIGIRNKHDPLLAATQESISIRNKTDNLEKCLPKQGTLIIKMKDGSKKIIDLSEAETVTVVP